MLSWELSDFGSEVSDLGSEGGFFEHSLSHSSSTYGQRMEVQCFAIFAKENTLPRNAQADVNQHFFNTNGSDDSAGNFSLLESFGLSTSEVADLCFSVLRSVIDPWALPETLQLAQLNGSEIDNTQRFGLAGWFSFS
ncbi:hypothetical protein Tco_1096417 [Tanacetum coccineum]